MKPVSRRGTPSMAVFVLVLAAASPAAGQTFRGGIRGTITDATGAALPGATVTITNVATKLTRTVVTDREGNYFIPELPLGDYSLVGELSGFASQTVTGIQVVVGTSQRVNLQLSPGGVRTISR